MDLKKNINGKPVIGEIKAKGIRYYVDIDKNIYTEQNDDYIKVTNETTLREILDGLTTHSIDVR